MSSKHGTGNGPRPLSDVLGELFLARGYSRTRATSELERAWEQACGLQWSEVTRVVGLRRGVLTIEVAHPSLLEELVGYRRRELLSALQAALPDRGIRELRMRVGSGKPEGGEAKGQE